MQIRHPQTLTDMWTAHLARKAKSDDEGKFAGQYDVQLTETERRIAELEDGERELQTLREAAKTLRHDRDAAVTNATDYKAQADDLRDIVTLAVKEATAQPSDIREQVLATCAQLGIPVPQQASPGPGDKHVAGGPLTTQQTLAPTEATHS